MNENMCPHFVLDDDILFGGGGGLCTEVCLTVLLFFCCVLRVRNELVVGKEELVELLDVLRKRVPSGLLGMG
jgi:hypothetical protein